MSRASDRSPAAAAARSAVLRDRLPLALVGWCLQIWVFWRPAGMRARLAMRPLPGLNCAMVQAGGYPARPCRSLTR
jgi:hypothetical protein